MGFNLLGDGLRDLVDPASGGPDEVGAMMPLLSVRA